jgi:hypothetical protein
MNEDRALAIGLTVIGAVVVVANVIAGGPVGAGETIGISMVLFGIRSWRGVPSLPRARVLRSR